MRKNEELWNQLNYTEENVKNAVALSIMVSVKIISVPTFQIPLSSHINNCLGRHTKSVDRLTVLTHEYISNTLRVVAVFFFHKQER